jgi:putative Mg2+ transporter-C (MgtC) family protein
VLNSVTDAAPWYVDVGRILFATVLGAVIGWERERQGREAGIRTYMATILGACTFGLISQAIGDQGRISSGVVTGIGFIGAGIILRDAGRITGLTTAATLWGSAAVGLAAAYGLYHLATISAVLILLILELHRFPGWARFSHRGARYTVGQTKVGAAGFEGPPEQTGRPSPAHQDDGPPPT